MEILSNIVLICCITNREKNQALFVKKGNRSVNHLFLFLEIGVLVLFLFLVVLNRFYHFVL